jgi:hypothetical protein
MFRSTPSVLAALTLAAATFTTVAASAVAEPEVSTSTLVNIPDSPKDFRLDRDQRKNKEAVWAGKASDITNATFTITGTGDSAVLEARISVARLLGKKHAYNQAVGLYGYNFQYNVKSDGTASFTTFRKKHSSCANAAHQRNRRTGVVTITMPFPCLATGLREQVIDARTWIHRRPRGITVGGDITPKQALVDITTSQFAGVQNVPW